MTAKLYNLARMTTATTGTGTLTLGSAVDGCLSFAGAGVSNGETVSYAIIDGSNSEVGRGVYTASGTTLTRVVLKSTNSDAAIDLSGTAQVVITALAEDFAPLDATYVTTSANSRLEAESVLAVTAPIALSGSTIALVAGTVYQTELYSVTLAEAGNFDVSSISQDYDDLIINMKLRSTVAANEDILYIYFNNDTTATNYSIQYMHAVGTTTAAARFDTSEFCRPPAGSSAAGDYSSVSIKIQKYASTTYRKGFSHVYGARRDATNQRVGTVTLNWESTDAINRITIQPDGYSTDKLDQNCWIQIIGVKTEA